MSSQSVDIPDVVEPSEPFWAATAEHRLVVQWCPACELPIFYPREACPTCLSPSLEWRDAAGTGVICAITQVHHRALKSVAGAAPFLTALVDLDEGVRMPTNLVGFDDTTPSIGQRVRVSFIESDGRSMPVFGPA